VVTAAVAAATVRANAPAAGRPQRPPRRAPRAAPLRPPRTTGPTRAPPAKVANVACAAVGPAVACAPPDGTPRTPDRSRAAPALPRAPRPTGKCHPRPRSRVRIPFPGVALNGLHRHAPGHGHPTAPGSRHPRLRHRSVRPPDRLGCPDVSTPQFLTLPPGVFPVELPLSHGPVAALRAIPPSGSSPELCPAVLVHGYTGSKEDFIALLQSLAQVGREVVAIDLPGTYRSPGFETLAPTPGSPLPDYRLSSLGMVAAEVCDTVGSGRPTHLVGHSMGGLISRETVLSHSTELASLTLLCSGPGALGGQGAARARMLIAALSAADPTPDRMRELWEEHMADEIEARVPDTQVRAFLRDR